MTKCRCEFTVSFGRVFTVSHSEFTARLCHGLCNPEFVAAVVVNAVSHSLMSVFSLLLEIHHGLYQYI